MDFEQDSAYHPDNVPVVTLITLERIYDMLAVIAGHFEPEKARAVINLHKSGQTLSPEPAIAPQTPTD